MISTGHVCVLVALFATAPPCAQGHATTPSLECVSVGDGRQLKLDSGAVANGFDKIDVTSPSAPSRSYLVDGVMKIPVGDEQALYGSMIVPGDQPGQDGILLSPDDYFEMYRLHGGDAAAESANTVLILEHQGVAAEKLDPATGLRTPIARHPQQRIVLDCRRFPEYLRHIALHGRPDAGGGRARGDEKRIRRHAELFASSYVDHNLVFDNHFLGVETWQNPFDLWVFQQMIMELKPDLIIETGTAHGGSALFFATILQHVNPDGRVVTVEIDPDVEANTAGARSHAVFTERVEIIRGDSLSAGTLRRIRDRIDGQAARLSAGEDGTERQLPVVLVTLDSLHSAGHVLQELSLYSGFVSKGSYIVVQDTIIDRNQKFVDWFVRPWAAGADAGPGQAVDEFLEENPGFERDHRWEKYYFTFYPGGFLRRR